MIYRLVLLKNPGGDMERVLLESREHLPILRRILEEFQNGTPPEMLREERSEIPFGMWPPPSQREEIWDYFY